MYWKINTNDSGPAQAGAGELLADLSLQDDPDIHLGRENGSLVLPNRIVGTWAGILFIPAAAVLVQGGMWPCGCGLHPDGGPLFSHCTSHEPQSLRPSFVAGRTSDECSTRSVPTSTATRLPSVSKNATYFPGLPAWSPFGLTENAADVRVGGIWLWYLQQWGDV